MDKSLWTPIEGTKELLDSHKELNPDFCPQASKLGYEERVKLTLEVGEELTTEEELRELFKNKENAVRLGWLGMDQRKSKEGQCLGKGVGRITQTEEANYYVLSYAFGAN